MTYELENIKIKCKPDLLTVEYTGDEYVVRSANDPAEKFTFISALGAKEFIDFYYMSPVCAVFAYESSEQAAMDWLRREIKNAENGGSDE